MNIENGRKKRLSLHQQEKERVAKEAFSVLDCQEQEKKISEAIAEIKNNKTTKQCPNKDCLRRYERSLRKCPTCNVFYEKYLTENPDAFTQCDSFQNMEKWTPEKYYHHIEEKYPEQSVDAKVLDPLLGNPNSKYNILALLHHVRKTSNIGMDAEITDLPKDGMVRERSRQWMLVGCDALIALQV